MLWAIDAVLGLLKDEKWHDLEEIAKKCALHEFKVEMIVNFLSNYDFIEFEKKSRKAKIRPLIREFIGEIRRAETEEVKRALRLR